MAKPVLAALVATLVYFVGVNSASAWMYQTDTDPMTDAKTIHAVLLSRTSLSLPFPYAGRNYGRLLVRQHPKYGLDVIVSVDKGQILCRSYDGCTLTVRFDSEKPSVYSAAPPADHSSDTVFVSNTKRFIASARKAKRILVQMTMFHAGDQVLEFETDVPLKWPPPSK